MTERIEAQQECCSPIRFHHERRHFEEKYSSVQEYRPHKKFNFQQENKKPERARGLKRVDQPARGMEEKRPEARHFPLRAMERGKESSKMVDRKKIVLDSNGIPCRYRKPGSYDLEKAMGKKKKIRNILDRRNGIDYIKPGDKLFAAADYSLGYFNNELWGGGVIPGSNFGFARATETTKESIKVFGKSLHELWNKCPQVPLVVTMCLEALEQPSRLEDTEFVFKYLVDQLDDEDPMAQSLLLGMSQLQVQSPYGTKVRGTQGDRSTSIISNQRPGSSEGHARPNSRESASLRTGRDTVTGRRSTRTSPKSISKEQEAQQKEAQSLQLEINKIRSKFDVGQTKGIQLGSQDPRIALGVLLLFLREMKPPLLTYDLYAKFMQSQLEPSPQARLEALRPTVAMLPPANEALLFDLMRYLNQLVKHPDRPVPVQVISKVIGPLILRDDPRRPTLSFLQDPSVEQALCESALSCMLDNANLVFPASALRPKKRRVNMPFHLRRSLQVAVENRDAVESLCTWEQQAELCGSARSDASSVEEREVPETDIHESKKAHPSNEDFDDNGYDEELEELLEEYRGRLRN